MTRAEEWAWAAGLFEGEGCFSIHTTVTRRHTSPVLSLQMADLDAVERFQTIVGGGTIRKVKRDYTGRRKQMWCWRTASSELVVTICDGIRPYMCARRAEKLEEVYTLARAIHGRKSNPKCSEHRRAVARAYYHRNKEARKAYLEKWRTKVKAEREINK